MEENKNSGEFEGFEDGLEGDYEPVTLVDEDGTESEYLIVDDLVDNGVTYYLLIAAGDEDSETADAQILKEADEDGESVLKELDDEEFDRISAMFENDDYSLEV